jgi:hypothetical protein
MATPYKSLVHNAQEGALLHGLRAAVPAIDARTRCEAPCHALRDVESHIDT